MSIFGVHLVEVTSHEAGWKGTWYRSGQRYFVKQNRLWPRVHMNRWQVICPGIWGGIDDADCRLVTGPRAFIRCLVTAIRYRGFIKDRGL